MKRALIFSGGWEGHQPAAMAVELDRISRIAGLEVEHKDTLDCLDELDLSSFDLIIPNWTMGQISRQAQAKLCSAVSLGAGLAGCHGGMGDAFRGSTDYQFMVGGQFVAHPGNDGISYRVEIVHGSHPMVEGLTNFDVTSEQYYLHVDPAIQVLATTHFPVAEGPHSPNGEVAMPVAWTKRYGKGNVFYCSLGHSPELLRIPQVEALLTRGFAWASREIAS